MGLAARTEPANHTAIVGFIGGSPRLGARHNAAVYPVIHLHAAAPLKPAEGDACNGCGVCCASEPCPVGMLVSRKRTGMCDALVWVDDDQRHRCGLIERPAEHLPMRLKRFAPTLARLAHRYIAAGIGCDCSDVVERAPIDA